MKKELIYTDTIQTSSDSIFGEDNSTLYVTMIEKLITMLPVERLKNRIIICSDIDKKHKERIKRLHC